MTHSLNSSFSSISDSSLLQRSTNSFRGRDPTVVLVRRLVTEASEAQQVAELIGVPVSCIDTALAQGASSQLLRSQVSRWIQSGAHGRLSHIEESLLRAVVSDATLRAVNCEEDTSIYAQLDDVTRQHFEYLRQSIGHSFVSILNDPSSQSVASSPTSSDWGGWFGSLLSASPSPDSPQSRASGPIGSGSLPPPSVTLSDFSGYLEETTAPFRAYCDLRRTPPSLLSVAESLASAENVEGPDADKPIPLPDQIPAAYGSPNFGVDKLLKSLFSSQPPVAEIGSSSDVCITVDAVDKEIIDLALEQLKGYDTLVTQILMGHVQKKSRQFYDASRSFGQLAADAKAARDCAVSARSEVHEGGSSLVYSFIRIAKLYRRRRNMMLAMQVAQSLQTIFQHVESTEDAIASSQLGPAADLCRNAQLAVAKLGSTTPLWMVEHVVSKLSDRRKVLRLLLLKRSETIFLLDDSGDASDWEQIDDLVRAAASLGCLSECLVPYCTNSINALLDGLVRPLIAAKLLHADVSTAFLCQGNLSLEPMVSAMKSQVGAATHQTKPSVFSSTVGEILEAAENQLKQIITHMENVHLCLEAATSNKTVDDGIGNNDDSSFDPTAEANTQIVQQWRTKQLRKLQQATQDVVVSMFEGRNPESLAQFSLHGMALFCQRVLSRIVNVEHLLEACAGQWSSRTKAAAPLALTQLRAALGQHVQVCMKKHHDRQFEMLMNIMTQEPWMPVEYVEPSFQRHCDTLTATSPSSIAQMKQRALDVLHPNAPVPEEIPPLDGLQPTDSNNDTKSSTVLTVRGHNEGFVVGNSILMLIQILAEYDWILGTFPFLASDVVLRMHDTLKLYDGQCAGLVLGAGAVDHGTFQSISLTHLSVGSECLSCLAAIAPQLQQRITLLSDAKTANFVQKLHKNVEKDFVNHRNEFYIKMITMFKEQIQSHTINANQWESQGNQWIMTLLTEAARFRRCLKFKNGACLSRQAERCVLIPAINAISQKIKEITPYVCGKAAVERLKQDLRIYKVNVEKFGYNVVGSAKWQTLTAILAANDIKVVESDADVWKFFDLAE